MAADKQGIATWTAIAHRLDQLRRSKHLWEGAAPREP